mmetsp:Transcript_37970/g.68623  ORF Transcript_37970/g.68623 Transcript_37970/m.68623 type:complete len:112 (+) Transcript_37970:1203-1538(+)
MISKVFFVGVVKARTSSHGPSLAHPSAVMTSPHKTWKWPAGSGLPREGQHQTQTRPHQRIWMTRQNELDARATGKHLARETFQVAKTIHKRASKRPVPVRNTRQEALPMMS